MEALGAEPQGSGSSLCVRTPVTCGLWLKLRFWDFPGPVVKISLSNAADEGAVPDEGAKILHASWLKKPGHETTEAIVTNSIKTLQMVHIKKIY